MTAHAPSLALSFLLISLTMASVLVFAAHRQAAGVRLWAVALVSYSISLVVGGIGGPETLVLRTFFANILLSASYALLGQGLLQFHSPKAGGWLVWSPVGLAAVVFALTSSNFPLRVVLGSLLFIGQILLALHLLNAGQSGSNGRGRPLIATGLLALVAIILWRMWEVVRQTGLANPSGSSNMTEAIHLGGAMVTVTLITVGLLVMNGERDRQALQDGLDFLEKLSANVPGVMYQFRMRPDGSLHFPYVSPGVAVFGIDRQSLAEDAAPLFALGHRDDTGRTLEKIRHSAAGLSPWHSQFRMRLADGDERWYEGRSVPERNADGSTVWHGYFVDIQEQKDAEARIRHLALHDALTGLPNRTVFDSHLAAELASAKRNKEGFGLLFLDLDGFKTVNDRFGHGFGDRVLKEVAGRLRTALRESDLIARIGGDEFVVLLRRVTLLRDAEHVAAKIHAALAAPFELETRRIACGTSIGIALYPQHGGDALALVAHADQAMYRAKAQGLGRTAVFHAPQPEQSAGNGL
ncbi:MAG: diguanylate cyclase domain-containing protein [Arenimonas sp.]